MTFLSELFVIQHETDSTIILCAPRPRSMRVRSTTGSRVRSRHVKQYCGLSSMLAHARGNEKDIDGEHSSCGLSGMLAHARGNVKQYFGAKQYVQ